MSFFEQVSHYARYVKCKMSDYAIFLKHHVHPIITVYAEFLRVLYFADILSGRVFKLKSTRVAHIIYFALIIFRGITQISTIGKDGRRGPGQIKKV